jgi:hypothetical protein
MRNWIMAMALAGGLGLAATAQAQPSDGSQKDLQRRYKRIQKIDFDSDVISGSKTDPGGSIFTGRLGIKHDKLIKVRQDWKKKLARSVSNL